MKLALPLDDLVVRERTAAKAMKTIVNKREVVCVGWSGGVHTLRLVFGLCGFPRRAHLIRAEIERVGREWGTRRSERK
jgi:hypothetical protein